MKDAPSVTPLSPRSPPPQTTSLRSQKPAWHRAPKAAVVADNRQRLILFVAGGMAYNEVREVYQLSTALQKDIYIGKILPNLYYVSKLTPNHKVLRMWSPPKAFSTISKCSSLEALVPKRSPTACATCEANPSLSRSSTTRNTLSKKRHLHPDQRLPQRRILRRHGQRRQLRPSSLLLQTLTMGLTKAPLIRQMPRLR